jgi:predicted RNA binding protein YcfA (HicA-like mRNA interferase family)
MTRLPTLTGAQVVKALQRAGFEVIRQRGSHVYLRHADGRRTVVPVHKGEDLGRGLLSKILRDVEMDRETFLESL